MDSHQRSRHYLFWRRVLLSLTVFSLLYVGAVRPLQSLLIDKVIFPAVSVFALDYEDVQLITNVDEIDLITKWPHPDYQTQIELPFNGHVWLALALFWIAKSRKLISCFIIIDGSIFSPDRQGTLLFQLPAQFETTNSQ